MKESIPLNKLKMWLGMVNDLYYPTDINVNSTFDSFSDWSGARLKNKGNHDYDLAKGEDKTSS